MRKTTRPSVKIVSGPAENRNVNLHISPTEAFGVSYLVGTGFNIYHFYFQICVLTAVIMRM